jgi:hypothetical protein
MTSALLTKNQFFQTFEAHILEFLTSSVVIGNLFLISD